MLVYSDMFSRFDTEKRYCRKFFGPRNLGPRVIVERNNGICIQNASYRLLYLAKQF